MLMQTDKAERLTAALRLGRVMAQFSVVLRMISKVLFTFRTCVGVSVTVPDGELTVPETVSDAVCPRRARSSVPVSDTSGACCAAVVRGIVFTIGAAPGAVNVAVSVP